LKSKLIIEDFIKSNEPIYKPITKFGGQPIWLTEPQWPLSRGWDNRPMMFICQIELDNRLFNDDVMRMAYIFVTHAETPDDDFFDPDIISPDEGENAVIIQPCGYVDVEIKNIENGPTLFDYLGLPYEAYVRLKYAQDPDFIDSYTFMQLSEDKRMEYCKSVDGNKIGGTPYFFQGDEFETEDKYSLLMQLNSNFLPFYLNLGASPTAHVFISNNFTNGSFLIQDM